MPKVRVDLVQGSEVSVLYMIRNGLTKGGRWYIALGWERSFRRRRGESKAWHEASDSSPRIANGPGQQPKGSEAGRKQPRRPRIA